jgi:6-phosphofructokinase 1
MASHIILPKEEEEEEQQQEAGQGAAAAAAETGLGLPEPQGYRHMETAPKPLPFSATCVRISRDSYPNLRALRNASAASLPDDDAAFVKLDEGDYGYVLDDVQHLTDYLPELPVSAAASLFSRFLHCRIPWKFLQLLVLGRRG